MPSMATTASPDPVEEGNMVGVFKVLFAHIMCMYWHFRRRCCFQLLGKC